MKLPHKLVSHLLCGKESWGLHYQYDVGQCHSFVDILKNITTLSALVKTQIRPAFILSMPFLPWKVCSTIFFSIFLNFPILRLPWKFLAYAPF